MKAGGKTNDQMKSLGRNEAKLANQFGGAKMKGGGPVMRGTGAQTKGKNTYGNC